MQQATCAHSGADTGTSPGNFSATSATRRGIIGALAAASAGAALSIPFGAAATPVWDAGEWLNRWHNLGCGLEVGGNALNLKGRLNGDREAIGAMLFEIAPAARQTALIEHYNETHVAWRDAEDPALSVVREMEAIDGEFVSEDVDPEQNAVWLDKWQRAFDRLPRVPATTGKGWAAKLRYAIEYEGNPPGDECMRQVLRHLEKGA